MFAEKLDAALAAQPQRPRPFLNYRARETVKAVIEGIVETCDSVRMTEAEQTSFALGYVRGAITVLRAEIEDRSSHDVQYSALPHLLEILDSFSQHGVKSIRTLAQNIAGQDLANAEARKVLDLPARPRDPLVTPCNCGLPDSHDPGDSVTRDFAGKDSFAGSFANDAAVTHTVYRGPCRDCGSKFHSEHPVSADRSF